MKAIWKGVIVAESNETVVIEGNHYFPHESIIEKYFKKSTTNTLCPWKGTASYYTLEINGSTNIDAAWYYPQVSSMASKIENYVAFWKGVEVVD